MFKYNYLLTTFFGTFLYKTMLIGIFTNETFWIAGIINALIYSFFILIVPMILALRKKQNYWAEVNKYTGYALIVFIAVFVLPELVVKFMKN